MTGWSGAAEAYRAFSDTLSPATVDRLPADAADGPLLDVGVGTGELAARAAAGGRSVVAVDDDPAMGPGRRVVPGRVARRASPPRADVDLGDHRRRPLAGITGGVTGAGETYLSRPPAAYALGEA